MAVVLAILVTLMTAGVTLLGGTGPQSCKANADLLEGLVERARTTAITTRSYVVLAIAEPGDLPADDGCCRIGLFKVKPEAWPDSGSGPLALTGSLLGRWQSLNPGIVLAGGEVDGAANPLDLPQVAITCGARKPSFQVHAIVFDFRGGLRYPPGSSPIGLRVAEGVYRNGRAMPNSSGARQTVGGERLKIGRVTARAYRIDG